MGKTLPQQYQCIEGGFFDKILWYSAYIRHFFAEAI